MPKVSSPSMPDLPNFLTDESSGVLNELLTLTVVDYDAISG